MKITPTTDLLLSSSRNPNLSKQKAPDLPKKPLKPRRKPSRTPRKSGPATPLLRWKFDEGRETQRRVKGESNAGGEESRRKSRRERGGVSSARKLGAALWKMQTAPEGEAAAAGEEERRTKWKSENQLGFKPEVGHGGGDHASRECSLEAKDPLRSPCSVDGPGPVNGYFCERQSPLQFSNYAMEGATKWDPVYASDGSSDDSKLVDQKLNANSVISALELELEQARGRIEELESEKRSQKKKVEQFLKKLSEERAAWRSREHEKVHAIIEDVKSDLSRERKNRQRLEIVNSKLVNELAEAKLSAKRLMHDYDKERKARELIEEVCDELAKEIGEDKAEVDALKKECIKIHEEVDDERKMLQMAEVWREERVQMKLIDAKVALDQKYSQMSWLVVELEKFLRSKGANLDVSEVREAEFLNRSFSSVNVKDLKEFIYEPSNSDDIFSVVEEMALAEGDHSGDVNDDVSGWETASHAEDSNVSGSFTEWEEEHACDGTPITEITEVCSVPLKKAKPISRLWGSHVSNSGGDNNYKTIPIDGGNNGRLSNVGRVSNVTAMSSDDRGSTKGGLSPSDMARWSSPDSKNPNINRVMKKGCIEWPRGGAQKSSLKHKLFEAKMETQKIQLRHVLKQKI